MKKLTKTAAFVLTLCMVMSLGTAAFADNAISTSGGNTSVPVLLTTEAATFSATVPTSFPVSVAADGTVTCASNLKIVNNSNGQIKVSGVSVTGANDWTLKAFDTDYEKEKTDAKMFGFKIQGSSVPVSGTADISNFDVIDGNGDISVSYDATIANQSAALNASKIADVVITLAWNN